MFKTITPQPAMLASDSQKGAGRVKRYLNSDALWYSISLGPVALILLLLTIVPIIWLFWMALHTVDWQDGIAHWEYVGLQNVRLFFDNHFYWPGLLNTFIFSISAVSIQMVLGFLMALVVSQSGSKSRMFLTIIFLLPIVLPPIVIGAIWKLMLSYDFGVINDLLGLLGVNPIDWLGNPDIALTAVIAVDIWHWTPFVFLLMLAGLESLPQDVYEAASLDVRNSWQEFWHITLPLMKGTILITLLFRMVLSFKVFDEIYLLTGGGPGTATEVVSFSIYRTFFTEDRAGLGSVMSVFTLLVVAAMAVLALAILKRSKQS